MNEIPLPLSALRDKYLTETRESNLFTILSRRHAKEIQTIQSIPQIQADLHAVL
jgi:hypothetical protein